MKKGFTGFSQQKEMAYSVNIIGLKELQAKMDKLPKQIQTEVDGVVENGAKTFVQLAKRDAPVNFGVLKNLITYYPLGKGSYELVSGAKYSPYLEWGTITNVFKGYTPALTPELRAYAATFWTRSKRNGGLYPHPFFFKQLPIVKKQIERDIKQITDSIKL